MYSVHTSNRGWLSEPNPFRHIHPPVTVQYDPAIPDDSHRLYYGDTPIDKVRKIGERSASEIRKRVQEHEENQPAKVEEVAPAVQTGAGGQMVLVF